jgi:DNA-binding Lrp family transcriptional regulator
MLCVKDKELISAIRENSRLGAKSLSKSLSLPASTIYSKLNKPDKVIDKYTCLLNFESLGYSIRAQIIFSVDRNSKEKASEYLTGSNSVNNLWKINGGYDFIAECAFKNLLDMETFRESLETQFKANKFQIHYLVEEYKREGFKL